MREQHDPEPWAANGYFINTRPEGRRIGKRVAEVHPPAANARRIVACVNACAGISNELLEQHPAAITEVYAQSLIETEAELTALRQQVADLRALITDYHCRFHSATEITACHAQLCHRFAATQPQEVQP